MRRLWVIACTALSLGCFVADEFDKGDELMQQLGPGKGAKSQPAEPEPVRTASRSEGPGILERLGRWWDSATEAEPPPPGPGEAVVRCRIQGSTAFMRASDCKLRGGDPSPAG